MVLRLEGKNLSILSPFLFKENQQLWLNKFIHTWLLVLSFHRKFTEIENKTAMDQHQY